MVKREKKCSFKYFLCIFDSPSNNINLYSGTVECVIALLKLSCLLCRWFIEAFETLNCPPPYQHYRVFICYSGWMPTFGGIQKKDCVALPSQRYNDLFIYLFLIPRKMKCRWQQTNTLKKSNRKDTFSLQPDGLDFYLKLCVQYQSWYNVSAMYLCVL